MPKRIQLFVHLLCSALFLSLCFLASPDWPRIDRMLSNPHGISDFVFQTELIFFFYFNFLFLLPRLYFRKKYVPYFLLVLLLFILFVPVTNGLIGSFFHHHPSAGHRPPPPGEGRFIFAFMNVRIYTFLLVFILSFLLRILSQLREIKNQNIVSELELLKAQINPHFFFNTLNTIYSLSVENSPKTPETILKLSSMMRYVLRGTKGNTVELKRELEYIQDYVSLQLLRLDPRVNVDFTSPVVLPELTIAPMILIPFIENVFKHGISEQGETHLGIKIGLSGNKLSLQTSNAVQGVDDASEKTQIGQTNSSRRLELLYPGRHTLTIDKRADRYELLLEILLDNQ